MKRAAFPFVVLVVLLAISLTSCDAMFSNNLFANLTHTPPSAAEMAAMTPTQIQDYIASDENLRQLADDQTLKAAALDNLASVYGSAATTADQQTAAIVAAKIDIGTVPDAAAFAAAAQAAILGGTPLSSASPENLISMVESALPDDIRSAIAAGSAMPAKFEDMIQAFLNANAAYVALGAGVAADGGYATGVTLGSSEKNEIAVDAVISGLLSAVVPSGSGKSTPEALWAALTGVSNQFTIASTALDDLTKSGPIASLVAASSLGSMLE